MNHIQRMIQYLVVIYLMLLHVKNVERLILIVCERII